jgi:hypothetical protein
MRPPEARAVSGVKVIVLLDNAVPELFRPGGCVIFGHTGGGF